MLYPGEAGTKYPPSIKDAMNVAILAKYIYLEVQCRQSPLKMKTLKRTKNFLIFIEFIGVTLVNKIYRL